MTTTTTTTTTTGESLADQLKRSAGDGKDVAAAAIRGIGQVAVELDMLDTAAGVCETEKKLHSDTFQLIVMGRFNNGKSTFLNALMGGTTVPVNLGGHHGPMVVDDLPATATLTGVRYSETPYVRAWGFDSKSESWPLDKYLTESTLDDDERNNQIRFSSIKEFEMGFPARLCAAGVIVYDSPGLDDHPTRTLVTRDASKRCDAAIVVYRSDQLMGMSDLMDVDRVIADGTRVFSIINLWGQKEVDDKLRRFAWNRYVRDHLNGPEWSNQNFAERDIYFINAGMARDGVYSGQPEAVANSGLAEFEQRLAQFLTTDRQLVHLKKFATQAENLASAIEQDISKRQQVAKVDQEQLREAAALVRPKLDAIRNRPSKLPKIIGRYRADAESALHASFAQLTARIRQELPAHFETVALASGGKFTKVFNVEKLKTEAAEVASAFITRRIATWSETEVPALMGPILERLADDIRSEVTQLSGQLDALNFELTGWQVEARANGAVVGKAERVVSAAAGLLFGDISAAVTGGATGFRGAAGGIGGALGAGVLLTTLGVTSAVVFFPLTLAAALFAGMWIGGSNITDKVIRVTIAGSDEILRDLLAKATPTITAQVGEKFGEVEDVITAEIRSVIDEEAKNIEKIIELNERDQSDRDRALAQLGTSMTTLARHRQALQQVLITARQTV